VVNQIAALVAAAMMASQCAAQTRAVATEAEMKDAQYAAQLQLGGRAAAMMAARLAAAHSAAACAVAARGVQSEAVKAAPCGAALEEALQFGSRSAGVLRVEEYSSCAARGARRYCYPHSDFVSLAAEGAQLVDNRAGAQDLRHAALWAALR
jgi:hypothetical protein